MRRTKGANLNTPPFRKAVAWVQVNGRFPFQVGPDARNEKLGVVRLGGSIERGESPWVAARREAMEEATLRIDHILPPATYELTPYDRIHQASWPESRGGPQPLLFGSGRFIGFLANSTDQPVPSSEARGLLLLSASDIESLCSRTLTLATYLDEGRPATFNPKLPKIDTDMTLDPRGPRVLKRLLDLHPEIGNTP